MTLISLLITLFTTPLQPEAHVEVAESEIEGIFIPAGFTGPIVAAPFTESAF
jgi:hypothetical protein